MSWLVFHTAAVSLICWGGVHQFLLSMDAILRLLEGLRRDELVWLNTYLTGRLRALPPPTTAAAPVQMPSAPTRANTACDPGGELPAAALAERVGDFNMSMDPWERTGAQHTCTRRYYLFKDIFSYDPTTLPFPPLELARLQLLEQRTGLLIQGQRLWDALEKRRHL